MLEIRRRVIAKFSVMYAASFLGTPNVSRRLRHAAIFAAGKARIRAKATRRGDVVEENMDRSSKVPAFLQVNSTGDALKLIGISAAAGAILMTAVGFSWVGVGFGWVTGGTAEQMATTRATAAVVAAYTPVCVQKFEQQANVADQWTKFKKTEDWKRDTFVEKTGFATLPGKKVANTDVAEACAQALTKIAQKQAPPVKAM